MLKRRMKIIDIAANICDPVFTGVYKGKRLHENDFNLMIERAKKSNITNLIVSGTTLDESKQAITLCKQNPSYLYSTVGCHPTRY